MENKVLDVHIPPAFVLVLWNLPNGTYGISYDIFTRRTEDNPPYGWNAARGEFRNSCESPQLLNRFMTLQQPHIEKCQCS